MKVYLSLAIAAVLFCLGMELGRSLPEVEKQPSLIEHKESDLGYLVKSPTILKIDESVSCFVLDDGTIRCAAKVESEDQLK